MYFFCLNHLNLSKYTTLEHKKHNFEGPLLKFQYSRGYLEKKTTKGEGGFVIKLEKLANIVYVWPLMESFIYQSKVWLSTAAFDHF